MDIKNVRKCCREFAAGRTEIHDEERSDEVQHNEEDEQYSEGEWKKKKKEKEKSQRKQKEKELGLNGSDDSNGNCFIQKVVSCTVIADNFNSDKLFLRAFCTGLQEFLHLQEF
ncbi:Hypothetical predicted protein [Octopus vulgaris]|uniref:Uncharacterized protein n=1 Tax=Octopus vulgaris TaxID=6645 RepID=A0AA36F4Y0_OCTVU|nr:Hypothetical predicted protein [Octopus vulgaris]